MNPHADDPRNASEVIRRKEELVGAATAAGLEYATALANAPRDNVAHIGVLARLLGIDALAALDTAIPLSQLRKAAGSKE
jgi:Pyruvate/2-oxoacid:ferredoxin oxidoreductase gamma subunit